MKTVLITGGSRGIGKAIAIELGKSFNVAVGYSSSKEDGEEVVEEIMKSNGTATAVEINVTSTESVENAFVAIEKEYGGIDVLVNNAGIAKDNILPRLKEDEWDEVINTNLTGPFRTSQRAIKHMMKSKWGRIIYISSIVGLAGNQGQTNYAASKAGLVGLSKSIAKEMGSRNITSNVIAPGYIDTDMTSFLTDEQKDNILDKLSITSSTKSFSSSVNSKPSCFCSFKSLCLACQSCILNGLLIFIFFSNVCSKFIK